MKLQVINISFVWGEILIKSLLIVVGIFCISIELYQAYTLNPMLTESLNKAEIETFKLISLAIISLGIIQISHSNYSILKEANVFRKSIIISLIVSIPVILIGSMFWIEGIKYESTIPDAAYLGDGIFKLGACLTFYTIHLKIFLSQLLDWPLNNQTTKLLQLFLTPILFFIQTSIYVLVVFLIKFGYDKVKFKRPVT